MENLVKDEMINDYELIIESISLVRTIPEYEIVEAMGESYRRKYPTLSVNADELSRKLVAKIGADLVENGQLIEA